MASGEHAGILETDRSCFLFLGCSRTERIQTGGNLSAISKVSPSQILPKILAGRQRGITRHHDPGLASQRLQSFGRAQAARSGRSGQGEELPQRHRRDFVKKNLSQFLLEDENTLANGRILRPKDQINQIIREMTDGG